ncbi:unannotated protein [freshwater metagenome]|uniref:Unannotated protein n=1 Tax=freshwater metagenome TaxID=449393 RepID=A0A6J7LCL6_9ZZZZ
MLVSECNRNFETGEYMSTIAIGAVDQQLTSIVIDGGALGRQPSIDELPTRFNRKEIESEQRRPTEQRRVHFKEWVLGGCADKNEQSAFDRWQQRVLL